MSKIQEKLDSLQPFIVGIRYVQNLQIVDAVFKDNWVIPNSDVIGKELVDESSNQFMFYGEKNNLTIDDILDYVEGVININIEREKKYELLRNKVEELKQLFKSNSLTKLERLKFSFAEKDVLPDIGEIDNVDIDNDIDFSEPTKTEEESKVETNNVIAKGQNIELPPKNDGKIEVEEFKEPEITCKCGPNDVCPVCEEEKFG